MLINNWYVACSSDELPPRRVRVDDYPTQEKYGWVWVFLGDLPEAQRPRLPELFPEFDDTAPSVPSARPSSRRFRSS